jgi:hypothetical protein
MSIKDYKGREIVVRIKPEKEDPDARPRRGSTPPIKPPDEFLARRRRQSTAGIFLDVYDMAVQADGTDRDYVYDPGIDGSAPNFTASFNSYFAGGPFVAADYQRITSANVAQYGISGSNFAGLPYDATRGFRTNGGPLLIPNGPAFHYFGTDSGPGGLAYTKVTRGTYADPEVSFSYDRDSEIFLAPRIWTDSGGAVKAIWGDGTSFPPTAFEFYQANSFMSALPRTYFLNNSLWQTFRGIPLFAGCFNNAYMRGSDMFPTPIGTGIIFPVTADAPADIKTSWRTLFQTRPGARLVKTETDGSLVITAVTSIDPTTFPAYDGSIAYNNSRLLPVYGFDDAQDFGTYISAGLFLGAMRVKAKGSQPEEWFYFWRKVSTLLWDLLCSGVTAAGGGTQIGGRYYVRN